MSPAQHYRNETRHEKKKTFCICRNEGADQLRSNCEADQHLTFVFARQFSKSLQIFCACKARFVSNLFGNHIVGFLMTRFNYKTLTFEYSALVYNGLLFDQNSTITLPGECNMCKVQWLSSGKRNHQRTWLGFVVYHQEPGEQFYQSVHLYVSGDR